MCDIDRDNDVETGYSGVDNGGTTGSTTYSGGGYGSLGMVFQSGACTIASFMLLLLFNFVFLFNHCSLLFIELASFVES